MVPGDVGVTITYHPDLVQGSDEWIEARRGLLTASEMHHIITPTGKPAKGERMRAHAYELLAQRITGHVEPKYINDDMLRGQDDEMEARWLYAERYAPVKEVGFIVRDFGEFKLGYSPDGLVGDDGLIEIKSRRAKLQIETIVNGGMPPEHMTQIQTGLLVSGRQWADYVSYSGGLPLAVFRIVSNPEMRAAIFHAAALFEQFIRDAETMFSNQVSVRRFLPTERKVEKEMVF